VTGNVLDLKVLADMLDHAGWDVSLGDSLLAVRIELGGVVRLSADLAGRILLTLTRLEGPDEVRPVAAMGRKYSSYWRRMIEVTVPLASQDPSEVVKEVRAILQALQEADSDNQLH
jgi:hypothetical protein